MRAVNCSRISLAQSHLYLSAYLQPSGHSDLNPVWKSKFWAWLISASFYFHILTYNSGHRCELSWQREAESHKYDAVDRSLSLFNFPVSNIGMTDDVTSLIETSYFTAKTWSLCVKRTTDRLYLTNFIANVNLGTPLR